MMTMANLDGILERLERLEAENATLRKRVGELEQQPAPGPTGSATSDPGTR